MKLLTAAGWLCLLSLSAAAQALSDPVPVPGTGVSLMPPPGFVAATQFPGFGQEESGASIMVTEIPGPYAEVTAGFSKGGLVSQGMTLVSKQEITLEGRKALLLHLKQTAEGMAYLKWLAALGDEKQTVLVTATFPEELKERLSEPLRRSVLSVRLTPAAALDPLAGLNYTVTGHPALKLAKRFSNALIFTADGKLPGEPTGDPLLVVAPSLSRAEIADRKRFAERRLGEIDSVTEIALKSSEAITIDGLPGYETIAEARDKDLKHPVTVYQVALFDGDSYYLIQGFTKVADQQQNLEVFRAVARTFRRK